MQKALISLFLLGITGCSNKAIYDNIRAQQRDACLNEPPPAYVECIERTNKTYEEYERERKEALESQEPVAGGSH